MDAARGKSVAYCFLTTLKNSSRGKNSGSWNRTHDFSVISQPLDCNHGPILSHAYIWQTQSSQNIDTDCFFPSGQVRADRAVRHNRQGRHVVEPRTWPRRRRRSCAKLSHRPVREELWMWCRPLTNRIWRLSSLLLLISSSLWLQIKIAKIHFANYSCS